MMIVWIGLYVLAAMEVVLILEVFRHQEEQDGGCAYHYLDPDGYGHQRNGTAATSYGNGALGGSGTDRGSAGGTGGNGWVYIEYGGDIQVKKFIKKYCV